MIGYQVVAMKGFDASLAALPRTPEVLEKARFLMNLVLVYPESGDVLPGGFTRTRVLRWNSSDGFPAVRFLYRYERHEQRIYFYSIQVYDELRELLGGPDPTWM